MPRKVVSRFTVEYLQILDENGKLDKKLEPDIPKDKLISLYEGMVMARRLDERMLNLQRQGRIGTFAPCKGQEVPSCVAASMMRDEDWFIGAFRELGGRLMRGEKLMQPLIYYNGFIEGSIKPEGSGRTLPINIIVGSQTTHAVGVAYASRYKGEKDTVTVVFLGDGATSEGDFYEAMNFATVWNVPVVFVIQNNQWAISIPRSAQSATKTLAQKGIAAEMPCLQLDGNDPLAMWVGLDEAIDRARKGDGPSLIEAETYRLMMHTTADDPTKYRKQEEVDSWEPKDPLIRFEAYLKEKKLWNKKKQDALEKDCKDQIDAAVKELEEYKVEYPDQMFDLVYGTKHDVIEEQRADFLENLRLEAENG